ncbi:DUF4136 domain-containing protein [Mesoterricola silvestris]|uniref:DUF4136 domain-containing protein n=1 Tax=Mesoterricola silvestris TaxID=2927979 RepID=A0AA48GTT4_9BACT|nr:DUF4136 domain-containing protein [Mesoterricola silvestris]BDU73922.1 hypothetical protein METEAL_30960 [Mesoterricola silvestris]
MRILASSLVVLALSLGCAGPEIRFDYDARANYQAYQAYDWYAAPKAAAGNPILDNRVRRAVEAELAQRGFRRETSADPQFLVTYYPAFAARRRSRGAVSIGLGMGGGPVGLGLGLAAPLGARSSGQVTSIVLEIKDFKTSQLVWKAAAEDVLDGSESPEDADAAVTEAVRKMLKRFPPTSKS